MAKKRNTMEALYRKYGRKTSDGITLEMAKERDAQINACLQFLRTRVKFRH